MKFASMIAAVSICWLSICDRQANAAETNYHTWVSRSGTDADTCGAVSSPCRNLGFAISKTYSGGEVQCLDAVDTASLSVTKSITVACDSAKWSNWQGTAAVYSSPQINIAAGDTVILRGLDIEGGRYGGNGLIFGGAGTLVLDNVKISGWTFNGVLFQPSGPGKLVVSNSMFGNNGDPSQNSGAAIRVVPNSGGTAQVAISRSEFSGNVFGIAFDGSKSTGGINATIMDSISASNLNDGLVATSSPSTAPAGVTVTNSGLLNNGYGIRSIGSNITVRLEGSKIIGNANGLSGGGALLSGGGNTVQGNGTNGSFTGSYALQ